MTDKELATYESVNAMIMLIGDFLHKVDHYREHIYNNQLGSSLIDRMNNVRDNLKSIVSDLVDYEESWIKKHNIETSDFDDDDDDDDDKENE